MAVDFPDPIFLTGPDGTEYVIACEGTLAGLLGVDNVSVYRATDKGLEFLTPKRRWENVESVGAAPRAMKRVDP